MCDPPLGVGADADADAEKVVWVLILGSYNGISIIWQRGSGKCSNFLAIFGVFWFLVGTLWVASVHSPSWIENRVG